MLRRLSSGRGSPKQFRFIVFSDFSIVTRSQCADADAKNAKIIDQIRKIPGEFGDKMRIRFPAPRSNVSAFDEWTARNAPVPADKQAVAVEFLADNGLIDNYAPEAAWSVVRRVCAEGRKRIPILWHEAPPPANHGGYVVLSDIARRSMSECIKADQENTKKWTETLNEMVKMQKQFPMDYVPCDDINPPTLCNSERKAKQLRESVRVPADTQRRAVLLLRESGLRVYRDYRPQEAMTKAADIGPYGRPPPPLYPSVVVEETADYVLIYPGGFEPYVVKRSTFEEQNMGEIPFSPRDRVPLSDAPFPITITKTHSTDEWV